MRVSFWQFLVAPMFVLACSDNGPLGPGAELEIAVAPLTLAGISDGCYTLRVKNGAPPGVEPVWEKQHVCASRYGDGESSISYIGTCDASGDGVSTVELELEDLFTAGTYPSGTRLPNSEWRNPCPVGSPCRLPATCSENTDTPVTFNLVVARDADQGFFDIGVNFEDVFCSGKVDCEDDDGDSLDLLFDPSAPDLGRLPSVVMALACTAGVGEDTCLWFDGVELVCGDTHLPLQIAGSEAGNVYSASSPAPSPIIQLATYRGAEALTQAGSSLGKIYFNLALSLDLSAITAPCRLEGLMTAAPAARFDDFTTPDGTAWPLIHVDVPLATVGGADYACGQHPLDEPDGLPGLGMETTYTSLLAPHRFAVRACADVDAPGGVAVTTAPSTTSPVSLAGLLFNDLDGSGSPGPGEPIANETLSLRGPGGLPDVRTTTSDAQGNYLFTGLTKGSYRLSLDPSSPHYAGFDLPPIVIDEDTVLPLPVGAPVTFHSLVMALQSGDWRFSVDRVTSDAPAVRTLVDLNGADPGGLEALVPDAAWGKPRQPQLVVLEAAGETQFAVIYLVGIPDPDTQVKVETLVLQNLSTGRVDAFVPPANPAWSGPRSMNWPKAIQRKSNGDIIVTFTAVTAGATQNDKFTPSNAVARIYRIQDYDGLSGGAGSFEWIEDVASDEGVCTLTGTPPAYETLPCWSGIWFPTPYELPNGQLMMVAGEQSFRGTLTACTNGRDSARDDTLVLYRFADPVSGDGPPTVALPKVRPYPLAPVDTKPTAPGYATHCADNNEASIAALAHGRLAIVFHSRDDSNILSDETFGPSEATQTNGDLKMMVSLDGGSVWSAPESIAPAPYPFDHRTPWLQASGAHAYLEFDSSTRYITGGDPLNPRENRWWSHDLLATWTSKEATSEEVGPFVHVEPLGLPLIAYPPGDAYIYPGDLIYSGLRNDSKDTVRVASWKLASVSISNGVKTETAIEGPLAYDELVLPGQVWDVTTPWTVPPATPPGIYTIVTTHRVGLNPNATLQTKRVYFLVFARPLSAP